MMFIKCEVLARLTSGEHVVEVPLEGDLTYCQVHEAAHRQPGAVAMLERADFADAKLWAAAVRLRLAEDKLRRLVEAR